MGGADRSPAVDHEVRELAAMLPVLRTLGSWKELNIVFKLFWG